MKLFFIGFCLNTRGGSFGEVRIMGVLQRFGIGYFVVASLHVLVYVKPENILPKVIDLIELKHCSELRTQFFLFVIFRGDSNKLSTTSIYCCFSGS